MNFILLDLGKVRFCEMFLNGEPYERVDVRFLREEKFENKNITFHKLCHSLRFIISRLLFKIRSLGPDSS